MIIDTFFFQTWSQRTQETVDSSGNEKYDVEISFVLSYCFIRFSKRVHQIFWVNSNKSKRKAVGGKWSDVYIFLEMLSLFINDYKSNSNELLILFDWYGETEINDLKRKNDSVNENMHYTGDVSNTKTN